MSEVKKENGLFCVLIPRGIGKMWPWVGVIVLEFYVFIHKLSGDLAPKCNVGCPAMFSWQGCPFVAFDFVNISTFVRVYFPLLAKLIY